MSLSIFAKIILLSLFEYCLVPKEPMNMSAYSHIAPCLCTAMRSIKDIKYVGPAASTATAIGFLQAHQNEQAELVRQAMQPDQIKCPY